LGVSGETPRLSWQLNASRRGVSQQRYEVHVASTATGVGEPDVWNSGVVSSAGSVDVPYAGPALTAYKQYFWTVRVWDDKGQASAWSPVATFETGPLRPADWQGDWIGADTSIGAEWTDYTVALDFTLKKDAFGVFFRGNAGLGYMWQINEETAGKPLFRPHVRNADGGYSVLAEIPLAVDLSQRHNLKITVAGQTITTWLDGTQIDQRNRSDYNGPGVVGFRTSGAENAIIHSLNVTNSGGRVLVDTSFPAGDATFADGVVLPTGGLEVKGGDLWLPGKALPLFRKDITVSKKVVSARIHAAAQGIYELRLNGVKVGDQALAPGWTDYNKRIQSQSYDVTSLLKSGANTLGAELSSGWFSGNVAMFGANKYGSATALVAQLRITYDDGTTEVVATDNSWRTAPGAVQSADLLNGESYDARRATELTGWDRPGYDASAWGAVVVRSDATAKLVPQTDQPVRITQQLNARSIPSPTPGTYLYDLNQNMVGVARLTLTGKPGQTVRIRYGEVLNPDGTLYTANLRSAKATDHYTFATASPETFQPQFTFHGFRYVEITGLDTAPPASAITGVVLGTDGDLTSTFDTSSALVNKLHSNIVWGQRGNFLSIPTDTPARDERMGWTGDINVFARTAVYNMDSQAFLTKWLQDLRDTQRADGAYASVAPVVPNSFDGGYGNTGWADAGVNVPWTLWQAYGDTSVIRQHYSSMTRYVDYLVASSNNLIRGGGDYGDWLNLNDPTPGNVIGTSFIAKGARQLSQMAAAIGNTADAAKYQKLYEDVKAAFASSFIGADGKVSGDSQTAYVLAFTSDLVPANLIDAAGKHFADTILRRDTHLSTGFLGVDGLLPVLTKIGRTDLAYQLLQNTSYPSWGYEIGKGATTVWERWNSINPDGSFNDVGMNSFNHYAYGAVGEWMYGTLAGVTAASPGYATSLIAPVPGAGIDFADFSHQTRYGSIASKWARTAEGGLTLDVTVPGNTTAKVRIPADNQYAVTESGKSLDQADHVSGIVDDGNTVTVSVGSGTYRFVVDPARSALGVSLAGADQLSATAASLAQQGKISEAERRHVEEASHDIKSAIYQALKEQGLDAAHDAANALAIALELARWISGSDARKLLANSNQAVVDSLSEAVRRLVGISAAVTVGSGEHLPGDVVPVSVRVSNTGRQERAGVSAALTAPAGWPVEAQDKATTVPAGGWKDFRFAVTVPPGAAIAPAALSAEVRFAVTGTPVRVAAGGSLAVASPVEIRSVQATPASGEPGTSATVHAVLHNRSTQALTGKLTVSVPSGWAEPAAVDATLAPGAEVGVDSVVAVPVEGNAETVNLTARFSDARGELVAAPAEFAVTQSLTPVGAIDYVDLGDAAAEASHNLTAAPSSGTSVEAGRSRRYSGMFVPGSWFEFDLGIKTGQPFLMRLVETYDHAQVKDYEVEVNGQVVHHRLMDRTAGGGLETYQFLVDDPALLSASTVRVRIRYNTTASGYDPSIADVWSLPLP
ncbi:MAG: alpha-L-rhamnosidase, partial [Kribbellaceae bacterium]|nr:alpha-L-rhamnosidase [Kribbellaceae bacterium]